MSPQKQISPLPGPSQLKGQKDTGEVVPLASVVPLLLAGPTWVSTLVEGTT